MPAFMTNHAKKRFRAQRQYAEKAKQLSLKEVEDAKVKPAKKPTTKAFNAQDVSDGTTRAGSVYALLQGGRMLTSEDIHCALLRQGVQVSTDALNMLLYAMKEHRYLDCTMHGPRGDRTLVWQRRRSW